MSMILHNTIRNKYFLHTNSIGWKIDWKCID